MRKRAAPKPLTPDEIDRRRVAAGVCRHCGGPVPCWSAFGDVRVGVRHPATKGKDHWKDEIITDLQHEIRGLHHTIGELEYVIEFLRKRIGKIATTRTMSRRRGWIQRARTNL